jgi:hypothetical protein
MIAKYRTFFFLIFLLSCHKDSDNTNQYAVCDSVLAASGCYGNDMGEYCTFGYKWGNGNPFSNAGLEKPGPALGPVEITYTFIDAGYTFSTHSQANLTSKSYNDLPACSKDTIRHALARWEAIAAITFIEKKDPSSDIKILMGDITQGGVSFPHLTDKPCSDLSGQIALNFNTNRNCQNLYIIVLHEIGHALGLGHVQSNNVMNPNKAFLNLQPGDIQGVQSIYGAK